MGWALIGSWWTSDFGTNRTNRAGLMMSVVRVLTGNDLQRGKTALLTHLRYRLNDERTDNGHNFLKPRGRSVKPAEEKRTCAAASCLVGCAAASMRYDDEIRVFSRLVAKSVVGNNQ
jgi:hypothetical protein